MIARIATTVENRIKSLLGDLGRNGIRHSKQWDDTKSMMHELYVPYDLCKRINTNAWELKCAATMWPWNDPLSSAVAATPKSLSFCRLHYIFDSIHLILSNQFEIGYSARSKMLRWSETEAANTIEILFVGMCMVPVLGTLYTILSDLMSSVVCSGYFHAECFSTGYPLHSFIHPSIHILFEPPSLLRPLRSHLSVAAVFISNIITKHTS